MTSVERISAYADLLPEPGYSSTLGGFHALERDREGRDDRRGGGGGVKSGRGGRGGRGGVDDERRKSENKNGLKSADMRNGLQELQSVDQALEESDAMVSSLEGTEVYPGGVKGDKLGPNGGPIGGPNGGPNGVGDRLGSVEIRNITVKYSEADADPVIRSLSLSIKGGSKVGVIGRTGCGKSTLLLALLQLNSVVSGDILVDGESLLGMDLERSRELFSVIPQDPHLFSGTIRFNLDPFGAYTDR